MILLYKRKILRERELRKICDVMLRSPEEIHACHVLTDPLVCDRGPQKLHYFQLVTDGVPSCCDQFCRVWTLNFSNSVYKKYQVEAGTPTEISEACHDAIRHEKDQMCPFNVSNTRALTRVRPDISSRIVRPRSSRRISVFIQEYACFRLSCKSESMATNLPRY